MAQGEFLTACEQAVNTAAGRQLAEDEMQDLVSRMESTVSRIRAENEGLSLEEAALRAAGEIARDDALAKHIEARNRVINLRLLHENLQRIDAFGGRPDLALSAIMVGRNEAVSGSRDSAFNNMRQLRDHYISGLANDLEEQGVLPVFSNGSLDQSVADAMWRLGNKQDVGHLPEDAIKIAQVLDKWQEKARIDANRAGAAIGKIPGYIARQSHDIHKIRTAGFETWRNAILPELDQRTFDGLDINGQNGVTVRKASAMTEDQIYGRARPAKPLKPENVGALAQRADGRFYIKGVVSENVDLMHGNGQVLRANFRKGDLLSGGKDVDLGDIVGFRNDGGEWVSVAGRTPRFDPAAPGGLSPSQAVIDDFLHNVYVGLSSGVHLRSDRPDWMSGFKGGGSNVARRASQERVLHFKDGLSWYRYNDKFGVGNLREAVGSGLIHSAETTGVMRRMGTNPENMFNELADRIEQRYKNTKDDTALNKFRQKRNTSLTNQLKEITGQTNIPGNAALARVAATTRAIETMMKLGGSMISSFNDIATQAMEMRYQGRNMLGSVWEATANKVQLTRWKNAERQQVLKSIGLHADAMKDELIYRFSADNSMPGRVNRAMRNYFRLNLQSWWTNSSRYSTGMMVSEWMGAHAGKSFRDVPEELRRVLSMHGIEENEWAALSKMKLHAADGNAYMTPDGVADIPRTDIENYLTNRGIKINDRSVEYARDLLSDKVRGYILDRVGVALNEPDARTMSIMKQGMQRGTAYGEMLRFAWQFKSFTASFMQNAIGRELYGRGYDFGSLSQNNTFRNNALIRAMRNGNGELMGVAQLFLWATAFGYLSMQTKLMLRGQTPRPADNVSTWTAAMAQGGGLGILGDFLFGEYNRFGNTPATSLAGPFASDAAQAINLFGLTKQGDAKAADYFNFAINHTPYMNLHVVRPVMDFLILNQMREWMSPGSLQRYQQRVKEEQGNDFIIPPSQFMLGR